MIFKKKISTSNLGQMTIFKEFCERITGLNCGFEKLISKDHLYQILKFLKKFFNKYDPDSHEMNLFKELSWTK